MGILKFKYDANSKIYNSFGELQIDNNLIIDDNNRKFKLANVIAELESKPGSHLLEIDIFGNFKVSNTINV